MEKVERKVKDKAGKWTKAEKEKKKERVKKLKNRQRKRIAGTYKKSYQRNYENQKKLDTFSEWSLM